MPEVTLFESYTKIQSDKFTVRQQGLKDLKHILNNANNVNNIADKGFHKMFEALFRASIQEKASITSHTKPQAREKSIDRLEACAETIKQAVDKCGDRLRHKTFKAVFSHILQVLSAPEIETYGGFMETYIRSLRTLLSYAPHTEHLIQEDWVELVSFCSGILERSIAKDQLTWATSSRMGTSQTSGGFSAITLETMLSLEKLVSAPQAYLASDGEHIVSLVDAVLTFLKEAKFASSITNPVSALNWILEAVGSNQLDYAAKIVRNSTPILNKWWHQKSNDIKDPLMVHLVLALPHIAALLKNPSETELRDDFRVLLRTILKDMNEIRHERERLQVEQIAFQSSHPSSSIQGNPLRTKTFALRPEHNKKEQQWMAPQLAASMIRILDEGLDDNLGEESELMEIDEDPDEMAIKRQRRSSHFDDLIRNLKYGQGTGKTSSTQILCFYLDKWAPDDARLESAITALLVQAADENTDYASWALLAFTAMLQNPYSCAKVKPIERLEVWNTALKNITSPSVCRAACHLLQMMLSENMIPFSDIKDSIDDLISKVEVLGPGIVSDCSIAFWHEVGSSRRSSPTISTINFESRVLQWLLSQWRPGTLFKDVGINSGSIHASVPEICSIIALCCGQEYFPYIPYPERSLGEIGQALQRSGVSLKPLSFLLLGNVLTDDYESFDKSPSQRQWTRVKSKRSEELEYQMLEAGVQQLDACLEGWDRMLKATEASQKLNEEGVRRVTSTLAIYSIFGAFYSQPQSKASDSFFSKLSSITSQFKQHLLAPSTSHQLINALADSVRGFLPQINSHITGEESYKQKLSGDNTLTDFIRVLDSIISSKLQLIKLGKDEDIDDDQMDIDNIRDGSNSRSKGSSDEGPPREFYRAECSPDASRMLIYGTLRFHTLMVNSRDQHIACKQFSIFIEGLSTMQLLFSRRMISDFLPMTSSLSRIEIGDLTAEIAKKALTPYEVERCEVILMTIIEMLKGLLKLWVPHGMDDDLFNRCENIYGHLILAALDKRVLSYKIRIALAGLLREMLSINMNFGQRPGSKSLRTNFLRLLQDDDIRVRYLMADYLPTMFSLYSIELHAKVYEDVTKYLEADIDNLEGLAMRVHSLSKLISASFHVMKNAVFHIFETAWKVPQSKDHATKAILSVAKTLENNDPKEVFRLFKSHIIHLFLYEDASFDAEFPFSIFGYATLTDLYHDAEDELIAQLLMFSRDEDAMEVAEALDSTYESLVQKSFHKIIAYSTAWISSSAKGDTRRAGKSTADSRIRKRLGDSLYAQLMGDQLAMIFSTFFEIYTEDDEADRSTQSQDDSGKEHHLARNTTLAPAWDILKSILNINHSTTWLGQVKKPAFKARVIVTSVNFICGKVNLGTIGTMWDAPLFTFIVRRQFEMINSTLGSMQSCAVIRTIRFILSLAGNVALDGYPLEFTIHGLMPYLVDPVCARDCIGILQYLFTSGKEHLITVPNFVLSSTLTMIASLDTFLATENTAPSKNSQLLECRNGALAFKVWLAEYLQGYKSSTVNEAQQSTFQHISTAVIDSHAGNTDQSLLRSLLRDEMTSGERLLHETTKRAAYAILGASFHRSSSLALKWVQNDKEAVNLSRVLYRICNNFPTSRDFMLWSARIFGRSFAASGIIYDEWTQESNVKDLVVKDSQGLPEGTASKISLLKLIESYLSSSNKDEVGAVESALRNIVFRDASLRDGKESIVERYLSPQVLVSMRWMTMQPPLYLPEERSKRLPGSLAISESAKLPSFRTWVKQVTIWLSSNIHQDSISANLCHLLEAVDGFAEKALPYLLHILLLEARKVRPQISAFFSECFANCTSELTQYVSILVEAVLYLRTQSVPGESTQSERDSWLALDYAIASRAAATCNLYKIALMFAELHASQTGKPFADMDLLLQIYRNTGEPDSYYGVQKPQDLKSIMQKFAFENDGWKSLSFQGARLENHMRLLTLGNPTFDAEGALGTLNALGAIGLNALSYSTLQSQGNGGPQHTDNMFQTAWKLEQWDLPCPDSCASDSSTIYRALQAVNLKTDLKSVAKSLDEPYSITFQQILSNEKTSKGVSDSMRTLAMLWEIEEILSAEDGTSLRKIHDSLHVRDKWMETGSFDDVDNIYSGRIATCSSMVKRPHLRLNAQVEPQTVRLLEAKTLINMCRMARTHNVLQKSLTSSVSLSEMVAPCRSIGVEIQAIANLEAANVLWEQGETTPAIGMLQSMLDISGKDPKYLRQTIPITRPELLSKTATWMAEARLRKPDYILEHYFAPAVKELENGAHQPSDGKVYHQFAMFCHQQLQDQGNLEDLKRAEKLMKQKEEEYLELEKLVRSSSGAKADSFRSYRHKAKTLFTIDKGEYDRLYKNRQVFLEKSLDNFLKCLITCDDYDSDATRFCSLWLEHSGNDSANFVAEKAPLDNVPSRKFIPMMNQMSSRLLNDQDKFQVLLFTLIFRICRDHPFHGLYQIMALDRQVIRKDNKDPSAVARQAVAKRMLKGLREDATAGIITHNLYIATERFMWLAHEKVEKRQSQVSFKKLFPSHWKTFDQDIPKMRVPPPTMRVDVRSDCQYGKTPFMKTFEPDIGLASGISMPKILACRASDNRRYKLLAKGGNDDLRQDAIMEQVFEQVSELLQKSRVTRQRNLGIRTYKVVPLSTNSGIIEFVMHTIPLHDYLLPAHQRYHPNDWKSTECRKEISKVQEKTRETRVKVFEQVMARFQPVMRFFFFHRFIGPDEWFSKRLAYTRTTAAISILGHILGLGDRHGHNILLDERSGEVVHIDLGVAFEQGRVLPVPEVVPFRLTRDVVDGMGITKTEGVFQRCCEFTLSVLRDEAYNIMTILDVLRYDPLYSWTISPVRAKKMQEELSVQNEAGAKKGSETTNASEADRALTVVMKKLSKTLSVQATVNELITEAGDIKNLAVLYGGWAAYV